MPRILELGTVCAGIYNQHRSKASAKIWKWNDFFPERDLREKRSDDELQDRAKKIMEMFNRGGKCRLNVGNLVATLGNGYPGVFLMEYLRPSPALGQWASDSTI